MALQKSKNRGLIIFGIIALIIGAGVFIWNQYKYKLIRKEVRNRVFEKSNGLYTLQYEKMDLDEVAGSLYVKNLTITPDTSLFMKMVKQRENPPLLLQIAIPEIRVSGVKTPRAMIDKEIEGRRVEVNKPIIWFYYARAPKDTLPIKEQKALYEMILGDLNLIKVDSIDVKDASLAFFDLRQNRNTIECNNLSVMLNDVIVDSLHAKDSSRFFFAKTFVVSAQKGSFRNRDNTYHFNIDGIAFNYTERTFIIKSLEVEPQLGEKEYARYAKLQKDRFNMRFNNISVQGINMNELMEEKLVADRMNIGSGTVKIYRDLSYPRDKKNRVGTYPHQAIMNAPFPLYIRRLTVSESTIELKNKNPKSDATGKLLFLNSSIDAGNVTNMKNRIREDNHMVIAAKTRFMGLTNVDARFDMLLNDSDGRFSFSGTASGFDASELNNVLIPLGLAKIESAKVKSLNFNFNSSDYLSTGGLTLLYDDLKVTLLKKDSVDNKIEEKKLASFISNLVVKNSNPDKKNDIRRATVRYERDTNRSFFHFIWFSIFTGVKETIGMEGKGKSKK